MQTGRAYIYPQSADAGVTPAAGAVSKTLPIAGKLEGVTVVLESGTGGSYTFILEMLDESGEDAATSSARTNAIEIWRVSAVVDGDFTSSNYNSAVLNAQVAGVKLTYSDSNAAGTTLRFILHTAGGGDYPIGIAT